MPRWRKSRREGVCKIKEIYERFPDKTIWVYTGYQWEEVEDLPCMKYVDVLVDGKFVEKLKDLNLHWKGSSNQKVIDVKRTREKGEIVLHRS